MREYEIGVPLNIRHRQERNQNDDDAARGPVDADLVNQIKVFRSEDVNQHTNQHDRPEHQHRLPLIRHKVLIP